MREEINAILLNDAAKILKSKIGKMFERQDLDEIIAIFEKVNENDLREFEEHYGPLIEKEEEESAYGGKSTLMSTLPVGTEFHVCNGNWDGKIVEFAGVKFLYISDDRMINLEKDPEYRLNIIIKK